MKGIVLVLVCLSVCQGWTVREWRNKVVDHVVGKVSEAANGGDFDAYQKAREEAAKDLEGIDADSAKRFRDGLIGSIVNATKVEKVIENVIDRVEVFSKGLLNGGVDLFVDDIKKAVAGQNPLPDVTSSSYTFSVTASGGHFGDLASMTRDGDFNLTRDGNTLLLEVPLKVADLKVVYDNYSASAFMVKSKGSVTAKVGSNRIVLRVRFSPLLVGCAVAVEALNLESLDGIEVDATADCRVCGVTVTNTKSTILDKMQGEIKDNIQKQMNQAVTKALGQNGPLVCAKILAQP